MLYFGIENLTCLKRCGRYASLHGWDHSGKKLANNLLVLIESGECSFRTQSETYELSSGDIIIVPKDTWYSPFTDSGCSYQYFQFLATVPPTELGESLCKESAISYGYGDTLPYGARILSLPQKISANRRVQDLLASAIDNMLADTPESKLKMNLNFLTALTEISENASDERKTLADRVKNYIIQHKFEDITLASICSHFGYTKQHLARVFTARFSCSPTVYIERSRLEHSATLLLDSSESVTEIAFRSGFSDPNYFARRFRKHFGISPSEYRATASKSVYI